MPLNPCGAWVPGMDRLSRISGDATDLGGKGTRCLWRRKELMHADRLY